MSRRTDRVAELLQAELAEVLLREVRDPRLSMASIATIDLSPDLRHARVRVSILGSDAEREKSLGALRRAAGFLRRRLAQRNRSMKTIPELHFDIDRGAEYSQRISKLLEGLDDDDTQRGA